MDEGSPAYYNSKCHYTAAKTDCYTYIEGIMCLVSLLYTRHFFTD